MLRCDSDAALDELPAHAQRLMAGRDGQALNFGQLARIDFDRCEPYQLSVVFRRDGMGR